MFCTLEQIKGKPMNEFNSQRSCRKIVQYMLFSFVNVTKWICPKLHCIKCFKIFFFFNVVLTFLLLKQEIFVTLCSETVPRDTKNDLETVQKMTPFYKRYITINYKLWLSYNVLAWTMIGIISAMLHLCYSYILCTDRLKKSCAQIH